MTMYFIMLLGDYFIVAVAIVEDLIRATLGRYVGHRVVEHIRTTAGPQTVKKRSPVEGMQQSLEYVNNYSIGLIISQRDNLRDVLVEAINKTPKERLQLKKL